MKLIIMAGMAVTFGGVSYVAGNSYLDTQTDIAKRKQAANLAYHKLKNILTSKKTGLGGLCVSFPCSH